MQDELLPYYERELTFIRQMTNEFSEKYPAVAAALKLEPNTCEDPHVERLIEAFALLAGRIHHKLDDQFPEITESLLEVLYPHYLRPIPSQAIVQFRLDPSQSVIDAPMEIVGRTPIHTRPEDGHVCSFRTCYPVGLTPLQVKDASISAPTRIGSAGTSEDVAALLRIEIGCPDPLRLSRLPLTSLRFYLNGERPIVHALYESLFVNALRTRIRALPAADLPDIVLPANSLRPVGFSESEGMLPYSARSFLGYRLLQEYFSFPDKFLFFDVSLASVDWTRFGKAFEILIALNSSNNKHRLRALEQSVNADTFQLNCTPVVNLFERPAEPIRLSHTQSEYRVIPDQHAQATTEIFSVDAVSSTASYFEEPKTFEPFYSVHHGRGENRQQRFWYAHRRPSPKKNDNGTEVHLSLVDLDFKPGNPATEMLTVRLTCTNRDQVSRLKFTGEFDELQAEGLALVQCRFIRKPTSTLRPPLRGSLQWRLISHLSLNHLSIVEKGRDALQEILRLYDFSQDSAARKRISAISSISSRPCISKIASPTGVVFCRGTDVTLEFDENEYEGAGVFLFASVLQRFLCLYSAVNSFTRVTVKTSKGVLKQWPPSAGEQILV